MKRLALLLGGGGTVGIAWESGVLAGLADTCGFDARESTVIVGTSAGSAVGAEIVSGRDPHAVLDLTEHDLEFLEKVEVPDLESGPFAEILALMLAPDGRSPENAARIGRLAVEAETTITEAAFVDRFRHALGTDDWPAGFDFRPTCTDCATGERRVFGAADGIELGRAVAASCAIPGFFPAVSFAGGHYMDGFRGRRYHADVIADVEVDSALYIGPRIQAADLEAALRDDMDAIAARGVDTHLVYGTERLDGAGLELMDVTSRRRGYEIGLEDGADLAPVLEALLG